MRNNRAARSAISLVIITAAALIALIFLRPLLTPDTIPAPSSSYSSSTPSSPCDTVAPAPAGHPTSTQSTPSNKSDKPNKSDKSDKPSKPDKSAPSRDKPSPLDRPVASR